MNKNETIAIIIICAAGCMLIEAGGYIAGWTHTMGEAVANWLVYTIVTSITVVALTHKSKNKKNDKKQ